MGKSLKSTVLGIFNNMTDDILEYMLEDKTNICQDENNINSNDV